MLTEQGDNVADTVRVYLADGEEGPEECVDVTTETAAALDATGLTYEPPDGPGTRWTYIGAADATLAFLTTLTEGDTTR